jgi:hypothetical protein
MPKGTISIVYIFLGSAIVQSEGSCLFSLQDRGRLCIVYNLGKIFNFYRRIARQGIGVANMLRDEEALVMSLELPDPIPDVRVSSAIGRAVREAHLPSIWEASIMI